jgi:hypothetical protein
VTLAHPKRSHRAKAPSFDAGSRSSLFTVMNKEHFMNVQPFVHTLGASYVGIAWRKPGIVHATVRASTDMGG